MTVHAHLSLCCLSMWHMDQLNPAKIKHVSKDKIKLQLSVLVKKMG